MLTPKMAKSVQSISATSIRFPLLIILALLAVMAYQDTFADDPPPGFSIAHPRFDMWLDKDGKFTTDKTLVKKVIEGCLVIQAFSDNSALSNITVETGAADTPIIFIGDQRTKSRDFVCKEETVFLVIACTVKERDVTPADLDGTIRSPFAGEMELTVTATDCQDNEQQAKAFVSVVKVNARKDGSFEGGFGGGGGGLTKKVDPATVRAIEISPEMSWAEVDEESVETISGRLTYSMAGQLKQGEKSGHVIVSGDPPAELVLNVLDIRASFPIPALNSHGLLLLTSMLLLFGCFLHRVGVKKK